MYELQLVNNGCLAEYSEDYKVFVESILLDSEALKKLYDKYCYFNFLLFDEEGIVRISRYLATVLLEI